MKGRVLGETLRACRKERGLSVRKAAARADMDPSVLSRIENNRRSPTGIQLTLLAEIYGKPLDELLAVKTYSEIKQKYGQSEFFAQTLKMLNEDVAQYGKY